MAETVVGGEAVTVADGEAVTLEVDVVMER